MARVALRERTKKEKNEWMYVSIGAGFMIGYLIALVQHQAALTKLMSSL